MILFENLLSLSILKAPLYIKVYLNIIPIFLGIYFLLTQKRVNKIFFPFYAMLAMGSLVSIFFQDIKSVLRICQVFCMVSFSTWIFENSKNLNIQSVLRKSIILSLVVLIIEIIFFDSIGLPKNFFGIRVPRYAGIIGESNYSAMFAALAGILLFTKRDYFFSILSFLLIIPCASRSAFLTVVLFLALYALWQFTSIKIKSAFTTIYFSLFSLSPLIIFLIHKFSSFNLISQIERISAGRFYLYIPYINMGIQNPFGIGYFRGWANYLEYQAPYLEIIKSIHNPQNNEQHNLLIQIFSEFGIVGYLFFIFFMFNMIKKYQLHLSNYFPAFMAMFFGYSFLNCMNEYMFWLILGLTLASRENYESTPS